MPTDANGNKVRVGDEVLIRATVRKFHQPPSNTITVDTVTPNPSTGSTTGCTLDATQVELAGPQAAEPADEDAE